MLAALDALVNPTTRGDPESPLRWTCKSARVLARELTSANHPVGADKVCDLLHSCGYTLMANAKTKEGEDHPDRNDQFEFINAKAEDFMSRGEPVISVDAKKKEVLGERANQGRDWQPKGQAVKVESHDYYVDADAPTAIPYGVYDMAKNTGFVNVGTDHNTPTFAAQSVARWWDQMGKRCYPEAKELFITADAGGSNAAKSTVWKANLQDMADRAGLTIHVSHFPPGTSKWNKIEHRLFSFISINWRSRPLVSYETVVSLIAATTTTKGLKVAAELDANKYPLGVSVTKAVLASLQLERQSFHGEWNYTLRPRTAAQIAAANTAAAAPERPAPITHNERRMQWLKLFGQQKRSGLNDREFCKKSSINYHGFIRARLKLIGKIRILRKDTK